MSEEEERINLQIGERLAITFVNTEEQTAHDLFIECTPEKTLEISADTSTLGKAPERLFQATCHYELNRNLMHLSCYAPAPEDEIRLIFAVYTGPGEWIYDVSRVLTGADIRTLPNWTFDPETPAPKPATRRLSISTHSIPWIRVQDLDGAPLFWVKVFNGSDFEVRVKKRTPEAESTEDPNTINARGLYSQFSFSHVPRRHPRCTEFYCDIYDPEDRIHLDLFTQDDVFGKFSVHRLMTPAEVEDLKREDDRQEYWKLVRRWNRIKTK